MAFVLRGLHRSRSAVRRVSSALASASRIHGRQRPSMAAASSASRATPSRSAIVPAGHFSTCSSANPPTSAIDWSSAWRGGRGRRPPRSAARCFIWSCVGFSRFRANVKTATATESNGSASGGLSQTAFMASTSALSRSALGVSSRRLNTGCSAPVAAATFRPGLRSARATEPAGSVSGANEGRTARRRLAATSNSALMASPLPPASQRCSARVVASVK